MHSRFASFFGVFALFLGANVSLAQSNPCAPFRQATLAPWTGFCYFNAYIPWGPVGSGFNAEINLRNPLTADTLKTPVSFAITNFYSKSGSTASGGTGVLAQIDGQPPEIIGGLSVSLNPGEKRDVLLLDLCYGDNAGNSLGCNNQLQLDKNPSVAIVIQVYAPSPTALMAQALLQYQDFVPGGTQLTMGQFWRDIDLSWEWQGPLIQTPIGSTVTPNRFNTVAVLNASDQPQVVQFDVIDELGRTFASMTTLQLPSNNLCPTVIPPWGSCGFLIVGRTGFKGGNGNAVQDPIGLFPNTTTLPVLYAGDGNFHGTLKVTTPSNSPLVVNGYTSRGLGTLGTLVFVPMPH